MKLRRKILLISVLGLVVAFSVACAAEYYEEEPPVLELWFWDAAMEEAARQMSFQNFNLQYSIIPWGEFWPALQSALVSGAGPDLFWMNQPNAVAYMPSGLLMPLDGFGLDLSGFELLQCQPFMHEGALYGLPISFDTVMLFYNKELFREAERPYPPRRGWSWDDLLEAALALTFVAEDEVLRYGLGISYSIQTGAGNFIRQNSGNIFEPSYTALEALQFMHNLMHVYRVSPSPDENARLNPHGDLFVSGIMAMEIQGSWRFPVYYEFLGENLGIAHLPRSVREATTFHNIAYMVSANTQNFEAVQEFLHYAASSLHGDAVASVFLPSHMHSRHLWPDIFSETLIFAEPLPLTTVNAGLVWDALNYKLRKIFDDETPIELEILQQISEIVNFYTTK